MQEFDAVVVGGGPGGYECAIRLSQNGLKTALVEEAELGGTCLNRGCVPTKTLLHAADLYYEATHGEAYGITAEKVSFDYGKIIQRKNAVSQQLSRGVAFLEKSHGVTVFHDHAVLADRSTVQLEQGETLRCQHLVLATGSHPVRLPIPGADLPGVVDSTGLLSRTVCPEHIVIIGGGVIGVEFATFFNRLGVSVTIVEMLEHVLATMDRDIVRFVEAELQQNGVELILGARVEAIEEGLTVRYRLDRDAKAAAVQGDLVLIASGRAPNTAWLGLEKLGVRLDRSGYVDVDGLCRSSVPGVYAVGDITGKLQLAHVASAQGLLAADHIAGLPCRQLNFNHIPYCVHCSPEAAMVGLTEEQARAAGRDAGSGVFQLSGNGKALAMGENKGFVKLVFDRTSDEILGFHAIGPRAINLAAEAAAVMDCEGTVAELASAVHPHPTVSEALMEAAHACHGRCVNAPKPRNAQ